MGNNHCMIHYRNNNNYCDFLCPALINQLTNMATTATSDSTANDSRTSTDETKSKPPSES